MSWLENARREFLERMELKARAKRLARLKARQLQDELEIYFDGLETNGERRSLQGEMQTQ